MPAGPTSVVSRSCHSLRAFSGLSTLAYQKCPRINTFGSSPSPMTVDKYPSSLIPRLGIFHNNCQNPPWVSSRVAHSVNGLDETPFTDFPFHLPQCFLKSPPKSTRIFAQSMLLGEIQMKTNVNYSCIYITQVSF